MWIFFNSIGYIITKAITVKKVIDDGKSVLKIFLCRKGKIKKENSYLLNKNLKVTKKCLIYDGQC